MSLIKHLAGTLLFIAWVAALEPALSAEIVVSQAQIERLEIRLEEARPATEEAIALLPATIIPPMNSRVAVPAPFAGTVVSVDVLPGQAVEQGRTLMTIASRELVETLLSAAPGGSQPRGGGGRRGTLSRACREEYRITDARCGDRSAARRACGRCRGASAARHAGQHQDQSRRQLCLGCPAGRTNRRGERRARGQHRRHASGRRFRHER